LAPQLNQLLENRGLEEGDPVGDSSMPNLLHTPRHTKATEFGAHRTAVGSQCRTATKHKSSAPPRRVAAVCARARACVQACTRARVLF
jgi:hypothetical protein